MTTRREVLILGAGMACLSACGGGSGTAAATHSFLGNAGLRGQPVYGVQIADWSDAQGLAGNASLAPSDLPAPAQTGSVLRIGPNAGQSYGQQNVIASALGYVPVGQAPGFSVGVWARNRGARTLNFTLRVLASASGHEVSWNCAIDPTDRWIFLTMSSSQLAANRWAFGSDAVGAVRISQDDDGAEGPWPADALADFGAVYVDVRGRPIFLITFDDGNDSQHNPRHDPPGSPGMTVASTDQGIFKTAGRHDVAPGDPIIFPQLAPGGVATGAVYWVQSVPSADTFSLATDRSLATTVPSSGFAGAAPFVYTDIALQSGQQIVERYGFKGSLFLVPSWLGTDGQYGYGSRRNRFMSAADAQALYAAGWSIGSHTNTHPSSADNAGLRLLGPYGYFLSNPVDNLPAQYVKIWRLDDSHRRRVTGAQALTNLLSFENPHKLLVNMPIMFIDDAPPGFAVGVTYFCQTTPTPVTASFATDQGSLASTVPVAADWAGLANYRYAGAANDDSAIYADIIAGVQGVEALGIPTGASFFALPQGAADVYVRAACLRAKLKWIRGASDHAHTIDVGLPTGGGLSAMENPSGGWLAQPDCIMTDGADTPTLLDITTYVNETLAQGACGCSYHHRVAGSGATKLENTCAYLRTKADLGLIDVITLDRMASALGL